MTHQGGIFATTHRGRFDRVTELIDWRGEVTDRRTVGDWILTATGSATIVSIDDRRGMTVLLHGTPEIDGEPVPADEVAERWKLEGRDFVRLLHGSYAFVIVDAEANRVHAVRDFMGTKPLMWGEHEAEACFASEPVAVPLLLGQTLKPDEQTIDEYLKFWPHDMRRTMVDGATALAPNSITTLAERHLVSESIPVTVTNHEFADDEAVASTRQVFDRAVKASARGGEHVIAAASAGLDSSSVAVSGLSQGIVKGIATARTVGLDEWDEVPRAALIAERFDVPHHVVNVDAPDALHKISERIFMTGPESPTAWHSIATLERSVDEGADSFLVGFLGDEWLSLAGGPIAQSITDRDLGHLPAYVRAAVKDEEIDVGRIPYYLAWLTGSAIKHGVPYSQRVLQLFLASGGLQSIFLSLERTASAKNIALGIPFADRRYVEHVLGLPAWQRNRPGQPKWLLRQAYADVLPEPYVSDPIKADFSDVPSLALGGRAKGMQAVWYFRATWVDQWRQALADRSA